MKVTNNKTKESYELSAEAVETLRKSKLAKHYTFGTPAKVPAELKAVQGSVKRLTAKEKAGAAAQVTEEAAS